MNKKGRGRLIAFSAITGFAAVGVAIPVGIVFGIRANQESAPTLVERDLSLLQNGSIDYKWGQKFADLIPPLDERTGYKSADYVGTFAGSGFDETKTPIGPGVTTIKYSYSPVSGKSGPVVVVTYGLNVAKGVSLDLSPYTPAPKTIEYGKTALPVEYLNPLLSLAGFGYKQSTSVPVEYKKSDNSPLTATELSTLPIGQTFSATYTLALDTDHYEATDATGATLSATVSYVQTYAVVPITSLSPTSSVLAPREIPVGIYTATTLPVNADDANSAEIKYDGYTQSPATPTAVVTAASTLTPTGNYISPTVGHQVIVSEIKDYNPGTEFTVTYSYRNDAFHTSSTFSVSRVFKVVKRKSTAPQQSMLPPTEAAFGKTTSDGANAALPTETVPPVPSPASLGGVGYDNGTYSYLLETNPTDKPLTVVETNKASNGSKDGSPDVGKKLGWDELATLNAGVVFGLDITYKPLFEYDGQPVTLTKWWRVVKQATSTVKASHDEVATATYTHGTNPSPLLATLIQSDEVVKYKPDNYVLTASDFYAGDQPVFYPTVLTPEDVMKLNVGDKFTARLTYVFNDNYKTTNDTDGKYYYRVVFTVA